MTKRVDEDGDTIVESVAKGVIKVSVEVAKEQLPIKLGVDIVGSAIDTMVEGESPYEIRPLRWTEGTCSVCGKTYHFTTDVFYRRGDNKPLCKYCEVPLIRC